MINPKKINEFVQKIIDDLPEGVKSMPDNFQSHLHTALQSAFSKMELVTREEFDTQAAVLRKTREKLEKIEKHINDMESNKK